MSATLSMNEPSAELQKYKDGLKQEGERLLKEVLPQRILELNKLLETPPFTATDLKQFHSPLDVPVQINSLPATPHKSVGQENGDNDHLPLENGERNGNADHLPLVNGERNDHLPLVKHSVPSNRHIIDIIETIQPIIRRITEETVRLQQWVTGMIPKLEDGNNFGVDVLEEVLGKITTYVNSSAQDFYSASTYYTQRAKLVSKVTKYPHLEDYRRAVDAWDRQEFVSLRLTLVNVRNRYSRLQDMITKNLDKIHKPRSGTSEELSMY